MRLQKYFEINMAKQKYCYIIVDKENGKASMDGANLPIYWDKKAAIKRQREISNELVVQKLELSLLEDMILRSNKA